MALFKSAEQKAAEQEAKTQRMLETYGLTGLTNPVDIASVRTIVNGLMGTGMMQTGMALSVGGTPDRTLPVYYQRAILEQNWIMIRQLDRISKQLDNLASK
jgi:hypothetical protein